MFPESKKRLLPMTIYLVCLPCTYPWEKRIRQKKYCIRRLSKEPEFIAAFCYNGNNSAQQSTLKRKYKPYLEILGLELDFELVNKFIQEREK